MRIAWWQGGVFLEPATDAERDALFRLTSALTLIEPIHQVVTGPVGPIDVHDEQPVVGVDVPLQVISDRCGSIGRASDVDPSRPLREEDSFKLKSS